MKEFLDQFSGLFIELPIVGIFVYVMLKITKDHRDEREKTNERFTESIDKSSDAITDLNLTTQAFHTEVKEWRRENASARSQH